MSRARVAALFTLLSLMMGCDDEDAFRFRPKPDAGSAPIVDQPELSVTVGQGGSVTIDPQVRGGDAANLSYSLGEPAHGTVTGTTPPFTYVPEEGFIGTDTFDITVSNGSQSVTVTVTVNVEPQTSPDAPVARDSAVSLQQDAAQEFTLDARAQDDKPLTYTVVTEPEHGALSGRAPRLVYTPERFYSGTDSLKFKVSDGSLDSNEATVTFTIEHVITCGDGMVETGEACDDGNQSNDDACRNNCALSTCGDGVVQPGEQCDDENTTDTDACRNNCMRAACGDGVVQAGKEACDDGNRKQTDACTNDCKAARCGDGFVHAGVEACDDGNRVDTDACRNDCTAASCGDGVVQAGVEQCDDGNDVETDGCLDTCRSASCGDSFVHAGVETCDDGNEDNTDACPDTCQTASCGDGAVHAGVEACDDGNTSNADACLNTCVVAFCSDTFVRTGFEECDDGNLSDGDGCSHSCVEEGCADGLVQFSLGEQCDDGNTTDDDGCDSNCQVEPFVTTTPVKISADLSCTTATANAARKVAVDGVGLIYAAMICSNAAHVVLSSDRGLTFSAPVNLSADLPDSPAVSQVAVVAPKAKLAYVVIIAGSGKVYLRATRDAGATWQQAIEIGTSTSTVLSLEAFNDNVFVGYQINGGVNVARNSTAAVGPFETTSVTMTVAFFDLLYDVVEGTLAVASDNPSFSVRTSTNNGVTFTSVVNPPGSQYFSDWAIGNGTIFVSGTNLGASGNSALLYIIPAGAPTTSTSKSGLPVVTSAQTRTVAADAAGNAYVASQLNGGGVQLDRLGVGAGSFSAPRAISATGGSPIAAPLPGGQGAAIIYTIGTSVYATIQAQY